MSRSLAACAIACIFSSLTLAENWPQFRGPHFNGWTDVENLPTTFSQTENVVWAADLPGPGAATPIVWDDRVFVSSTDSANDLLCAMCIDRTDGKILWRRDVSQGIRKDIRSDFASPTPATDGNVVIFFYGNGDLAAIDFSGREVWKRNIQADYGQFAFLWTFSSSPVIYDGKMFLQVLQRDVAVEGRGFADKKNESYLLALDPATGQEIWRVARPSNAVAESREAFTTPTPFEFQGRKELLVAGGDALTGHDPDTGEELWRWGTWNPTRIEHWRLVPSPVAGGGVILACAPKRDPIYAVKAGGAGLLSDNDLAWVSQDNQRIVSSDVPTPAFADGDFFILNKDGRVLSRVDPATGEAKWTARTPGRVDYEASPLVADGKVYVVNHDGRVVVFDAANGNQLADVEMDQRGPDRVRASIVAAQGQLFVRTTDKLYCIAR